MWVIVAESVWGVVRLVGIVMRVNIASWHEAEREGQKKEQHCFPHEVDYNAYKSENKLKSEDLVRSYILSTRGPEVTTRRVILVVN